MRSRGSSTEMLRRLWTRAPWTAIVVRGPLRAAVPLAAIGRLREEERELLHGEVATPGQQHRRGGLADQPQIRKVLARDGDPADVEIPAEVILDVAAGADVSDFAQVV